MSHCDTKLREVQFGYYYTLSLVCYYKHHIFCDLPCRDISIFVIDNFSIIAPFVPFVCYFCALFFNGCVKTLTFVLSLYFCLLAIYLQCADDGWSECSISTAASPCFHCIQILLLPYRCMYITLSIIAIKSTPLELFCSTCGMCFCETCFVTHPAWIIAIPTCFNAPDTVLVFYFCELLNQPAGRSVCSMSTAALSCCAPDFLTLIFSAPKIIVSSSCILVHRTMDNVFFNVSYDGATVSKSNLCQSLLLHSPCIITRTVDWKVVYQQPPLKGCCCSQYLITEFLHSYYLNLPYYLTII